MYSVPDFFVMSTYNNFTRGAVQAKSRAAWTTLDHCLDRGAKLFTAYLFSLTCVEYSCVGKNKPLGLWSKVVQAAVQGGPRCTSRNYPL